MSEVPSIRIILLADAPLDYNVGEDQLKPFLPTELSSEQLNFGQGEGQFRVESAVWGIYFGSDNNYEIQYEEGDLSPEEFATQLVAIRSAAQRFFGCEITVSLRGCFESS